MTRSDPRDEDRAQERRARSAGPAASSAHPAGRLGILSLPRADNAAWVRDDPFGRGQGLGLLLRQRAGRWVITRLLERSPAQRAALQVGDEVRAIDAYVLPEGDFAEALRLLRASTRRTHVLEIVRARSRLRVRLPSAPIAQVIRADLRAGAGDGSYCLTCRKCYTTLFGWIICGRPRRPHCADPCGVA